MSRGDLTALFEEETSDPLIEYEEIGDSVDMEAGK